MRGFLPASSVLSPSVLCLTVRPPSGPNCRYIPSTSVPPCLLSFGFQLGALQFPLTRLSSSHPPRLGSRLASPARVSLGSVGLRAQRPEDSRLYPSTEHGHTCRMTQLGRNCFFTLPYSPQHSPSAVLSNGKCLWVLYQLHCPIPPDRTTCSHVSVLVADHRPEDVSIFPPIARLCVGNWCSVFILLKFQGFILPWMADGRD